MPCSSRGGFALQGALGDDRILKLMGIGLATAILVDATIVRLLLVPATMGLLGDRNWWLPGWLDRALPELHEGASAADRRSVPSDDVAEAALEVEAAAGSRD